MLDEILCGCYVHVRTWSSTPEEYLVNVLFGAPALDFLGHCADATGIRPKVQIICNLHLWELMGLVNFYRHFVPHSTTLLQPLNSTML